MIVVYTGETPPDSFTSSIFLAGPSPRKPGDANWREGAIKLLEEMGYGGVVFAPVYRDQPPETFDYEAQVGWERRWLNTSDQIVFWVPRDLKTLPGFTTNVEYGMWLRSGKILLGSPDGTPKMDYLDWWAKEEGIENFDTLQGILECVITKLGAGALRTGGEREVPLALWLKPDFQNWVSYHRALGNRLDGAEIVWNFRVGPDKSKTFLWALHANLWVASEKRSKTNEVVIFRPDISTIVAYCRPPLSTENDWLLDTEVVLIREFRSPVNNSLGMVCEVPGGSSLEVGENPDTVASMELSEETGLSIHSSRFQRVGVRQIAATLCAHRAHVYAVELTPSEMLTLKWGQGSVSGGSAEEITYPEVRTLRSLLLDQDQSLDWSNIGMLFQALSKVLSSGNFT